MKDGKLIHSGNLIDLYKEPVPLDSGEVTFFDIVKHPGGSVVAAINDKNEYCLLKQWRHAVRQYVWEFPAGCLEKQEVPLKAAKRELEEEAGVKAAQWVSLGEILPSPGFSNEVLHLFKASELSAGIQQLDAAEKLEAHWLSLEEIKQLAQKHQLTDAKSLTLLYKLSLL